MAPQLQRTLKLAGIIWMLGACERPGADPVARQGVGDSAVPATTTPASRPARWQVSEVASEMDDSRRLTLSVRAEAPIQAWLKEVTPELFIRCRAGATDVYVVTDTQADIEGVDHLDEARIRVRVDSGPARSEWWGESTSEESYFAPNGARLLREIRNARTLRLEFTPFRSSPTVIRFDLEGLGDLLPRFFELCPPAPPHSAPSRGASSPVAIAEDPGFDRDTVVQLLAWVAVLADSTYYWADCPTARVMTGPGRRYYKSKAEAEAAGFRRASAPGC